MAYKQILVLLVSAWLVAGQRPSFAGFKPIGFPDVTTTPDPFGNRFGEEIPLPVEAKGDRALVERISKLPIDKQPFWYINWKALEENRKNPQTYPQRENSFTNNFQGSSGQPQSSNFQSNPPNSQTNAANSGGLTSKFGETNNRNGNFANAGTFSSSNSFRPNQGYTTQRTGGYYAY